MKSLAGKKDKNRRQAGATRRAAGAEPAVRAIGSPTCEFSTATARHAWQGEAGAAPPESEDAGSEADGKDLDRDAEPFGDQIMTELVEQDHDAQDHDERQRELPDPADVLQNEAQLTPPRDRISSAAPRDQASASRTLSSDVAGTDRWRCSTLSTTRGMPGKSRRPDKNAPTAISFAAFSTAGAVPPSRSAPYARSRLGKRRRSTVKNSSRSCAARS